MAMARRNISVMATLMPAIVLGERLGLGPRVEFGTGGVAVDEVEVGILELALDVVLVAVRILDMVLVAAEEDATPGTTLLVLELKLCPSCSPSTIHTPSPLAQHSSFPFP
jgi:hypothetical protein